MTSRFDVTLNGVSLLRAVPEVTILDITPTPAQPEDTTVQKGWRHGSIVTKRAFQQASVTVTYDLSIYDPKARMDAVLAVQAWAINGGKLMVSDREGQFLQVRCAQAPAITSSLKWIEPQTIQFVAYECPFWQADEADTQTITGSGSMEVGGIVDYAPVSATIKSGNSLAAGTNITTLTVTCGSTEIKLEGMTVNKSKQIKIGYDSNGFLTIKTSDGTDLMQYRTGSDELLLPCGKTSTVKVASNSPVTCVLSARGRWL